MKTSFKVRINIRKFLTSKFYPDRLMSDEDFMSYVYLSAAIAQIDLYIKELENTSTHDYSILKEKIILKNNYIASKLPEDFIKNTNSDYQDALLNARCELSRLNSLRETGHRSFSERKEDTSKLLGPPLFVILLTAIFGTWAGNSLQSAYQSNNKKVEARMEILKSLQSDVTSWKQNALKKYDQLIEIERQFPVGVKDGTGSTSGAYEYNYVMQDMRKNLDELHIIKDKNNMITSSDEFNQSCVEYENMFNDVSESVISRIEGSKNSKYSSKTYIQDQDEKFTNSANKIVRSFSNEFKKNFDVSK